MNTSMYVTYEQVEEEVQKHYERYGSKSDFKDIVQTLFKHRKYRNTPPDLPLNITWSSMDDTAFFHILKQLPVKNLSPLLPRLPEEISCGTKKADIHAGEAAIVAESIMPDFLEVYAILYIRNIIEKMHTHNFFEVNYVLSGHCKMIFENQCRELHSGELCIIAPYSRHDVTIEDDSIVISLMLRKNTFDTTFFQLLAQEDLLASFFRNILYSQKGSANYMLFVTDSSSEIKASIKDIIMESYISDTYANTCIVSRIHLLFSLLLRRYGSTIQFYDDQKNSGGHGSFLPVLQYIQTHYQTVTLDSLAKFFHYNTSYLSRAIRKNTGRTLTDILTELKTAKALKLLLHTNLKIEEISAFVGYDSVDHFSRVFKRTYGASPRHYRQQLKS